MLQITLGILIAMIIYCVQKKDFTSPIFIFSCLWFTVIGLYSMRLYHIYSIKRNTQLIILLGILFFILGALCIEKIRFHVSEQVINNDVNFMRLAQIYIFIIISSLYFYIPNIALFFQGIKINAIKMMLVTGELKLGGVWMQYVVRPFTYIIIATMAYYLVRDNSKKILLICGITITIFEFIGTGSKTVLLYAIVCVFFSFFSNKHIYVKNKILKISIPIFAIALFLLVFMGIKSVYFYVCGCIPMLDKVINDSFYTAYGNAYGFVSFNSIIRFFIKIISLFGFNIRSELFDHANDYIGRFEYTTSVSTEGSYNAFHTYMGDFFVDFGLVGVIILSFLFGVMCMSIYKLFKETDSLWGFILYAISLYYIVFSIVRFQMSNTFLGLMLLYTILFMKTIIYKKVRFGKIKI